VTRHIAFAAFALVAAAFFAAGPAVSQDRAFIQLEAHSGPDTAAFSAERFAQRLEGMAGFQTAQGRWFAVVIGPFDDAEAADAARRALQAQRQIPGDAFVVTEAGLGAQFWPEAAAAPAAETAQPADPAPAAVAAPEVMPEADTIAEAATDVAAGTADLATAPQIAQPAAEAAPAADEIAAPAFEVAALPVPEAPGAIAPPAPSQTDVAAPAPPQALPPAPGPAFIPEETLAEAQQGEAALDRDARAEIQEALTWFGHYAMAIDAAFGPGTRRAMTAWQEAEGHEPTGVLTTRQRAQLIEGWQAEVATLGFAPWRDETAGIEITLPLGLIAFDRYEAPFVHFRPRGDSGVQALLISQQGSLASLFALYEIMQTLEIVPLEGFRERGRSSFTLTGQNERLASHTYAEYRNGQVKGFTLIWTPGADAGIGRAVEAMQASLSFFGPALPDGIGQPDSAVARADLLAGLEVRRPVMSRSGFYIDPTGKVLTSVTLAEECRRLTIDERYNARVFLRDDALGILVLQPEDELAPLAFANFAADAPEQRGEVVLAGFSFEDLLTRPILTFGQLAGLGGLDGNGAQRRLSMSAMAGDIGGPVFDRTGQVIGMLVPQPDLAGRVLPEDVNFVVGAEAIVAALRAGGLRPATIPWSDPLPSEELTLLAADMTVLISCWN
jgi:S1-C subfamily serine protease